MNFQICRPAVTDPHKVRPCNYCYPAIYEYLLKYSDLHLEYFWRTSCYIYPPLVNIDPHSLYFPVFTPKFDRLVWLKYAFPCLPIYRVCRYWYVAKAHEI